MSRETRFSTEFTDEGTDEPGLVLSESGDVEVVRPSGTREVVGAENGGSQPEISMLVDTVTFADFVAAGGSWPGQAPFRTFTADQLIIGCCWIEVTEAFNDSATLAEIQVTDDPNGEQTQISNAPDPTVLSATAGAITTLGPGHPITGQWPLRPTNGPVTPIVGLEPGFVGDGTTGAAVIYTLIYTPAS